MAKKPVKGANPEGRPPLWKTVSELEAKIEQYKAYLSDSGKPPTIAGLAYHLGVDRQTIYNYKAKDEFFGTIKRFVDWILMNHEEYALMNPSSGIIFLMKNYGYTDKQEMMVEATVAVKIVDDINE